MTKLTLLKFKFVCTKQFASVICITYHMYDLSFLNSIFFVKFILIYHGYLCKHKKKRMCMICNSKMYNQDAHDL